MPTPSGLVAFISLLSAASGSCARRESPPEATRANDPPQISAPILDATSPPPKAPEAASPCPTQLPAGQIQRPPVEHRPDIEKLVEEGRRGTPRRITLKFHNPIAACVCTDFNWDDTWPDTYERRSSPETHLIFPKPVPNGYTFTQIRYHGRTDYEITGYFSGRELDTYEFHRLQYGEELGPGDDEERSSWAQKYPEFCVEAWCFNPDPNPTSTWPIDPPKKHATEYRKILGKMRAAGVAFCADAARER